MLVPHFLNAHRPFGLLFALLLFSSAALWGQSDSKNNAQVLVENLLQAKVFVDYSKVKKDIEAQLVALNAQPNLSAADYAALQGTYLRTKAAFDGFIGVVRQDMLDFQLFEKAAAGDEPTILRYMTAYNAGVDVYNREFLPTYNRVVKTRVLPAWLVPLGIQAFRLLATAFKGKNPRNEVVVNDLLMVSNYLFVRKMEMKPWEALVTVQPSGSAAQQQPPVQTDTPTEQTLTAGPTTGAPSALEYPAMKSLQGQLQFLVAGTGARAMAFEAANGATRDLVIGSADPAPGVATPVFTSTDAWPEGTAFQVRVQNSALLYAFALNSNGKCAAIYPFSEEWVRGFVMSKSRDLTVGPLMLQDAAGEVVIPAKNAQTGQENYIRISGPSTKEQFCLLVSKSELDLKAVMGQIEGLSGTLAERVAALWQAEPHCATAAAAQVTLEGTAIRYSVTDETKWLLPFVFEIRR